MDRSEVLARVRKRVEGLPGVMAFQYLDAGWRKEIMLLEKEAESNGACGGLMPFTNKGVWSAFEREVQFVIVASSDSILLGDSERLVYIQDQKGNIVGEWVGAKRLEQLKGREDVCFLSSDFVLYPEVEVVGEPFFVLPDIDFPYLDGVEGVKDVASGSISTLSDDHIRERLGFSQTKHWTHLVGFNVKE
ncbi:MAG: hypothetical protein LUQ16_07535 [Methanomassiliicoccales archaeon]|nr:hypothetical protein [Methanomassiliicoccales archaeon]MDD1756770.1 hypothetical protein [Methanomassiliicoccales archaeon]